MNLYEINAAILQAIDDETGEIIDEKALEDLTLARDEKIENIACWIKNLTAEVAALKAEKEAFAERQKKAETKIKSLKQYLSSALNGSKFSTSKVNISFRKSETLAIEEGAAIPNEYLKLKVDVDKAELKKAVKGGLAIDGVFIHEKQNIQIK